MNTVSASKFAEAGITLSSPSESPKVSQSQAEAIATARYPGTTVRESVLAHYSNTHRTPKVDRLCWVISLGGVALPLLPAGGKSTPTAATFWAVAIDGNTGQYVEGFAGT